MSDANPLVLFWHDAISRASTPRASRCSISRRSSSVCFFRRRKNQEIDSLRRPALTPLGELRGKMCVADPERSGQSHSSFLRQGRVPTCSAGSSVPALAEESVCVSPRPHPSIAEYLRDRNQGYAEFFGNILHSNCHARLTSRAKPASCQRHCITAIGRSTLTEAPSFNQADFCSFCRSLSHRKQAHSVHPDVQNRRIRII